MSFKKTKPTSNVVCFVGISGKPGTDGPIAPLCKKTLSGRIVSQVEATLRTNSISSAFVRDNLVEKPPLSKGRLRYPTLAEMHSAWSSFERRLAQLGSNVIILLGKMVAEFFLSKRKVQMVPAPCADGRLFRWMGIDNDGRLILAVAHPAYIGIYARNRIDDYAAQILGALQSFRHNRPH